MYILDKLKNQIQIIKSDYKNLQMQNNTLQDEVNTLKNQLDQYKYNNENMLLNIDKALQITSQKEENNE